MALSRQLILEELDRFAYSKTLLDGFEIDFSELGKLSRILFDEKLGSCIAQLAQTRWLSFCCLRMTILRLKETLKANKPRYIDIIQCVRHKIDYVEGFSDMLIQQDPSKMSAEEFSEAYDAFLEYCNRGYRNEGIDLNHKLFPMVLEITKAYYKSESEVYVNNEPVSVPYNKYDDDNALTEMINRNLENDGYLVSFLPQFLDNVTDNMEEFYEMLDNIYNQTDEKCLLQNIQPLKFMDIIDKVYDLFHGVLFKECISKPQLLMILNNIGGHIDAVEDRCRNPFAAMIYLIAKYYNEERVADDSGIQISSYKTGNKKINKESTEWEKETLKIVGIERLEHFEFPEKLDGGKNYPIGTDWYSLFAELRYFLLNRNIPFDDMLDDMSKHINKIKNKKKY